MGNHDALSNPITQMALGIAAFYFLPSIIALIRGVRSKMGVFLLNLLLGWTLLFWVVALVWSFSPDTDGAAERTQIAWTQAVYMAHNPNTPLPQFKAPRPAVRSGWAVLLMLIFLAILAAVVHGPVSP